MKNQKPTELQKPIRELKPAERRAIAGGPGDDETASAGGQT